MPLQNRVLPNGEIVATSARGTLMGNRGLLHNDQKEVVRPFRLKAWITCALEFKGRKRQLMSPGTYTELFFLDEVTALAAGHRPCAECRRQRFNAFKKAWQKAHSSSSMTGLKVANIDIVLHQQRLDPAGRKLTWRARLQDLPVGTMIQLEDSWYAIHGSGVWEWTIDGYGSAAHLSPHTEVEVLTPAAIVAALRSGYLPLFHASVGGKACDVQ